LRWYAALGFGSQIVAVVPKLDLVVTVLSDSGGEPVRLNRLLFERSVPSMRR
jgi:hypothetical protein